MSLMARVQPRDCICGARVTTVRCKNPDHDAAVAWRDHVAKMQAFNATLQPYVPGQEDRTTICFSCGHTKWLPAGSIDCVECMARGARRRPWSEAECDLIRRYWGLRTPAVIAERIYKATGSARTAAAVAVRAHAHLGLDYRTNQPELWTVSELAEALGVHRDVVVHARERGWITPVRGHHRAILYFATGAYDILARMYPPVPFERSISAGKAAEILGYRTTHIGRLLKSGVIHGVQRGVIWHVDAASVEDLAAQMREYGADRLDLKAMGVGEADRRRYKSYVPRRRELRAAKKAGTYSKAESRRILGVSREEMTRLLEAGIVRGHRDENRLWRADKAHVDALAHDPRSLRDAAR